MNREQWLARAEAYREAADHLDVLASNDDEEGLQRAVVAERLRRLEFECVDKADERAKREGDTE